MTLAPGPIKKQMYPTFWKALGPLVPLVGWSTRIEDLKVCPLYLPNRTVYLYCLLWLHVACGLELVLWLFCIPSWPWAESVPFAAAHPELKKGSHHSTNEHSPWKGFMIHTPAVLQAGIPHFAKGKSMGNRILIHQSIRLQRFVFCILMIEFICQVDFPFQKVENSTEVRIAPSTQNLGEYMDYPLPIIRWSTRGFSKFAPVTCCACARHCGCRRKKGWRWRKGHRLLFWEGKRWVA